MMMTATRPVARAMAMAGLLLSWPATSHAAEPVQAKSETRVYVTNERSGDVSVIDAATNEVAATIPVGKRPRGIRLSPVGRTVYVALSGSPISPPGQEQTDVPADKSADGIGVIDVATGRLTGKLPSGSDPEQFSLDRDGKRLYVSNEDANTATVVDVARAELLKTIPVGVEPEGVVTSPDGRLVYVTSETTNAIHVIGTADDAVVATFPTAQRPRSVAFTPDGAKAYVTCETAGVVDVVDVATSRVVKQIKPAAEHGPSIRPMGAVVAPDGRRAYVTSGRGKSVLVIDVSRDEIEAVIADVGDRPWGIGITPDGKTLYTANGPSNDVSVIDTATLAVTARIQVGTSPWGIAIAR
jgi:PQQ-dependent catabolism-associated beta-propeller protein